MKIQLQQRKLVMKRKISQMFTSYIDEDTQSEQKEINKTVKNRKLFDCISEAPCSLNMVALQI